MTELADYSFDDEEEIYEALEPEKAELFPITDYITIHKIRSFIRENDHFTNSALEKYLYKFERTCISKAFKEYFKDEFSKRQQDILDDQNKKRLEKEGKVTEKKKTRKIYTKKTKEKEASTSTEEASEA